MYAAPIIGVGLPVGHVELRNAGKQKLEVARVEPTRDEELRLEQFVKSVEQRLGL